MKKISYCAIALVMLFSQAAMAEKANYASFADKHLGKTWYGIYINGKKCGYGSETREKITYNNGPAYKFSLMLNIKFEIMGTAQQLEGGDYNIYYPSGELAECYTSYNKQSYKGVVKGDVLEITSLVGGVENKKEVPTPDVSLEDEVAPMRLILGEPEIGDAVESKEYDLTVNKTRPTKTTVIEKSTQTIDDKETTVYTVDLFSVDQNVHGKAIVPEDGIPVTMELPLGMINMALKKEDEQTAKNFEAETFEALDATMKRPTGKPLSSNCKELTLKITGLDENRNIIDTSRQKCQKNEDGSYTLTITRDALPRKIARLPIEDKKFAEFLKPTEIYQSSHPEIVKAARMIVGNDKNSARVAQKLCLWVFANLQKAGTAEYSNALDTLRSKSGDCSEHSVLFVALCRAVGLPARELAGLGYSSGYGAFGGHAWAEVYVGEWIAVDPTFGEPIASCGHIQIGKEYRDENISMLDTIGKMNIEVLECK